jgi:PHD/YefM family antitoxin component YafN of YafNO toxin-antitoxin module
MKEERIPLKIPNLTDLMISVTDFKKQIADIMSNKKTKVIIRNNEPVSIIMPYEEYLLMSMAIKGTGETFTLSNGVVMKVLVEIEKEQIAIKQYIQIKSTGEFKLHFTQFMSNPRKEQSLTNEELMKSYEFKKD